MSTYIKKTKNPKTGEYEDAMWIDDYFGSHHYGVMFPDGAVFDPENAKAWPKIETSDEKTELSWNDFDMEKEEKKALVSHGFVTHPAEDWKTCEDCVKTQEAFDLATEDGTIDRMLGTVKSPQGKEFTGSVIEMLIESQKESWEEKLMEYWKYRSDKPIDLVGERLWVKSFISQERLLAQKEFGERMLEKKKGSDMLREPDGEGLQRPIQIVPVEDIETEMRELEI